MIPTPLNCVQTRLTDTRHISRHTLQVRPRVSRANTRIRSRSSPSSRSVTCNLAARCRLGGRRSSGCRAPPHTCFLRRPNAVGCCVAALRSGEVGSRVARPVDPSPLPAVVHVRPSPTCGRVPCSRRPCGRRARVAISQRALSTTYSSSAERRRVVAQKRLRCSEAISCLCECTRQACLGSPGSVLSSCHLQKPFGLSSPKGLANGLDRPSSGQPSVSGKRKM